MGDNHPLQECFDNASKNLWPKGFITFQKFTCVNCGNRLTVSEPNVFYAEGECDNCGAVTDIEKEGCNFALVFSTDPKIREKIMKGDMDE